MQIKRDKDCIDRNTTFERRKRILESFGNYIHTYYYDKSILDGYTLKIIREDIETQYKERLSEIYENLKLWVEKKDVKKSQIVEHDNYVKELLRYIISDPKEI